MFSFTERIPSHVVSRRIARGKQTPLTGPSLACLPGNAGMECELSVCLRPAAAASQARCRFQETFPSIYAAATSIKLDIYILGSFQSRQIQQDWRETSLMERQTYLTESHHMEATFPRNYAGIGRVEGARGPAGVGGGALSHRWRC